MTNNFPIVSVIIATFNSHNVLPRTLVALQAQTYPQDRLELMVIDGGSTDNTLYIARNFGCLIYNNPLTNPGAAKLIGYRIAKGRYVMTLDHDEVLINPYSIENRINALISHPDCKCALLSGYIRPTGYPRLNQYLSDFGDPFSYFMYHGSSDCRFRERTLAKHAQRMGENEKYILFRFPATTKDLLLEIGCMGSIIDIEYFRKILDFSNEASDNSHKFYMMLEDDKRDIIYSKNDPLEHYSVDSIGAYLPKLKWRIINNIHYTSMADDGYTGRQKWLSHPNRKYLFPLYSIATILPLAESIYLSVSRRNPIYLLHPYFCWYVTFHIILEYAKKIFGKKSELTSYDGKKNLS